MDSKNLSNKVLLQTDHQNRHILHLKTHSLIPVQQQQWPLLQTTVSDVALLNLITHTRVRVHTYFN